MLTNLINNITIGINSTILTIIIPILFISLLFSQSKFYKKDEWNEDYLSKTQTKIIKGFCAVGIVLHHLAQKTAAPWLESKYIIHGLDFFVNIGYLFVGAFLFISGFGLYKSLKANENYFENYFSRRILPIIIAYLTTNLVYYFYDTISSTYNWYVVAILVCYILFYFGFKYFKKEYISFLIVIVGIVIYSAICNFMMLGGWWFNTVGLFVVGLLYAKFEKKIVPVIKKVYVPLLIVAIVITCFGNWYGRYFENVVFSIRKESLYNLYSLYIILFRFIAAVNFTLIIILVSLKCKFNNKVLSFYGSISLEFYLIQGLFVQAFSYCYFDINIKPLYYIKNVPLYAIVVIVLATAVAFVLNYADKKIHEFLLYFYEKRKNEINYVFKALKIVFIVLISACLLYILVFSIVSMKENADAKKYIDEYKEKYITFTDVGNKKMAAYIVGSGKDTLVFMRGNNDPCPSISMRYLADSLSDTYKVVVLDYLGTGFSDKPSSKRTSANIANEIHEALHNLNIEKNYILVPEYISGLYAQEYVKKYKEEVKGVIALESEVYPERKALTNYLGASPVEYHKFNQLNNIFNYCLARLASIKGPDLIVWHLVEDLYLKCVNEDEIIVAKNIFFKNIYNSTYLEENKMELVNYESSVSAQYPRKTYVYDIISNTDSRVVSRMGQKSEELHAQVCFDRSKHYSKIVNDLTKSVFYASGIIHKIVDEAVSLMK